MTTSTDGPRGRSRGPFAGSRIRITALLALIGALAATAFSDTITVFVAEQARFLQPADHEVGGGNGDWNPRSANGSAYHYVGEDCSRCHVEGGKATNYVFTMAGTVYSDYWGTELVEGAEVIMQDEAGKTFSMTTNEEGNFFTYERMSGVYKSWIRLGERTVPMVTLPSVGSTQSWMGCAMHHTPNSTRGAMFVPTGRTLKQAPAAGVSFRQHVLPLLLGNCRPCHLPASAKPTTTRVVDGTTYTYDYSGGLDLTSYDGLMARTAVTPDLLDPASPAASLLLAKVLIGGQPHGGGNFWKADDPDYQAVLRWIAEGAADN